MLLCSSLMLATPAGSQQLEEVVVTAGFRDEPLLGEAGSATVIGSAAIERGAATHLESVLGAAPNVSFSSGASRARFVQMRGVGDLEQFVDPKHFPSVGIAVDDIQLGGTANAAMLFDTEQVEILRGPQGTRFGANALAGLVNVRGRRPTDVFEGFVSVDVADYSTRTLVAAVGGPLADSVAGRLAVQQHRSDGYIENRFLGRDDTNGFDELSLRASLSFEPAAGARYSFTALGFEGDNGYDAFSLDNVRTTLSDEPGHDRQTTRALAARGEWDVGDASTIEAVLTWLDSDVEYGFDEDWTFVGICDGTLCDPVLDFYSNTDNYYRDRRDSTADVRWLTQRRSPDGLARRYVVGIYGQERDESLHREYYGDFFSDYATDRRALYAELEAELSARLSLTLGYRYERFDDGYDDSFALVTASEDTLHNGEISLGWRASERTLLYATISRGDKAGGVNTEASASLPLAQPQFQQFLAPRLRFAHETLVNKEIGLKGRYVDDRLSVRAALFRMDRDDAQLESWVWDGVGFLWIGLLDNAGGSNLGAETEIRFALNDRWNLTAAVGLLSTDVDEIVTFDLDAGDFVSRRGIDQAKAPDWAYHVGAVWSTSDAWEASIEVEGRDSSRFGYYHDGSLRGYTLVNSSIKRMLGRTELRLWARNLTDQRVEVHGLYFGNDPRKGWVNETYVQLGEPRIVGATVSYAF